MEKISSERTVYLACSPLFLMYVCFHLKLRNRILNIHQRCGTNAQNVQRKNMHRSQQFHRGCAIQHWRQLSVIQFYRCKVKTKELKLKADQLVGHNTKALKNLYVLKPVLLHLLYLASSNVTRSMNFSRYI